MRVLGLEFPDLTLPGDRKEPTAVAGLDAAPERDDEGGSGRDLICSGPVDLIKSAKSLVTPLSILASRGIVGPSRLVMNSGLFWKVGFIEAAVGMVSETDLGLEVDGFERRPFGPFGGKPTGRLASN